MRVLRLDLADGSVELHPFVTVVRGLTPEGREELLAALAALPRGEAPAGGLLEVHGVLLDLTADVLDLLDLGADLDVVVRAGDLPGSDGDAHRRVAAARRAVAEAEDAAAQAARGLEHAEHVLAAGREALAAARAGAAPGDDDSLLISHAEAERRNLERAEAEHAAAEANAAEQAAAAAVLDAEAASDAAQQARTDATRAVSVAAAALEAAADRRDPMAASALESAANSLAEAEAATAAAREGDEPAAVEVVPTAEDVERLRARRVEAEAAILALETADPFPVRLALEQLGGEATTEPVPDPEALRLADAIADLDADLDALELADDDADDDRGGDEQAAARARLASAHAQVASAEAVLRGPVIEPEDVQALELAHAAVLEARDQVGRRFRKGDGAKRLVDAEAGEEAALAKLGFATWTDYLMNQPDGGRDPAARHRLELARSELAAASAAVRDDEVAVAGELRRAELLDRRRALRDEAVRLLGDDPGDDIAEVLRNRRIAAGETGGHLARLRAALEATGLVLGDEDLPERTLADLGRVWLEEHELAVEERHSLERRVAELDALLAEAARAGAQASQGPSPLATAIAAADDARAAYDVARARVERHEQADEEVEARRTAFATAAAAEEAAMAAVAEAEAALVEARATERDLATRALELGEALEAALAAEQAAIALLAGFEARLASAADRVSSLEADLATATTVAAEASAEAAGAGAALEGARRALADAEAAAADGDEPADPAADAEDAEWFLLARLAGQRAVSYAGSVPLVLDDALAAFGPDPARRLLERLERMGATVQVVVVTEDLATAAWAEALGPERAAVVERVTASSG